MNTVLLWCSKTCVAFLAISALVSGQKEPETLPTTVNGLVIELKTDRITYALGEPIRFTVLLVNKGASSVYIAKSFLASGGGIAGFDLFVKPMQGTKSKDCTLAADRFGDGASRSAKQILKEDFLPLAPGGIVGYTGTYHGCAIAHEGTYEITARYCPCDLNTSVAQSAAKEEGTQIITKSIRSKPWVVRVHAKAAK